MRQTEARQWLESAPPERRTAGAAIQATIIITISNHRRLQFWRMTVAWGGGDSSVVKAPDSWLKGRGFTNPCRSGGRIFFSRADYLCWLLFRYAFHPRVTAVARKSAGWQVTVKHAYTLRMWLCMKWHGAWLYGVHRTCAETAAVSCGTSHASAVSTPLRWIFKNAL